MKLIVGLGNPELKYEKTRHNIGFRVARKIAGHYSISSFSLNKKFEAEIAEQEINKEKIIIAQPQTYMNHSGRAVRAIADYYKIRPQDILVVHDDIDIPFGQIKVQTNRGAAGHKGVQSIIDHLKTKDFIRVRIGIRPENSELEVEKFVLEKFSKEEELSLSSVIKKAISLIFEFF